MSELGGDDLITWAATGMEVWPRRRNTTSPNYVKPDASQSLDECRWS